MLRHGVQPRTPFVRLAPGAGGREATVRRSAAAIAGRLARMALAPLAAVVAALGGVLFLVLLPICGIASIAEAVAKASWAFVRDAFSGARGRAAPHG